MSVEAMQVCFSRFAPGELAFLLALFVSASVARETAAMSMRRERRPRGESTTRSRQLSLRRFA